MQPQQNPASGDVSSRITGDRSALARVESSLKERRAELTRMMAEMRDLYHSGKSQAQVEIESLCSERLQLQQHLDQRTQELSVLSDRARAFEAQAKETEQHYQNVLAEAEAALAEQGTEIGRLVAEFKQSRADLPGSFPQALSQADARTLSPQEMRELIRSNKSEVSALPAQAARELTQAMRKIEERDEELKLLRAELGQRDQLIQEFHAQQYAARLTASTHPVELEKLRGQLNRVQEDHRAAQEKLALMAPPGELEKLRGELRRAGEQLQEANRKLAATGAMVPAAEAEKLRSELVHYREQVQEANRKAAAAVATAPAGELEKLKGELVRSREQLQEANRKAAAAATMVPAAEAEKLRNELIRTREQLQDVKNKVASASTPMAPAPAAAELDNLQKELARLKTELADKEKALHHSVPASDVEKLIAELGRSRSEIARLQQASSATPNASELEQLRAELTILQEESREKDRKLEEIHGAVDEPHPTNDPRIAQYEAELIRYHRQLETDRQTLNQSIQELEKRNAELTLAAQKAQQDLSGERAQLNQLRDELHIDLAFEDLAFLARKHLAPIQPAKKK